MIHQGAARDAASVYFHPSIRRTDIPVLIVSVKQHLQHLQHFSKQLITFLRDKHVSCGQRKQLTNKSELCELNILTVFANSLCAKFHKTRRLRRLRQ